MNVTEIETIIQKITDRLMAELTPKNTTNLAFDRLEQLPQELADKPEISWVRPEQEATGLVVKCLSLAQMASIANLQITDFTTKQVQRYLLAGKPVWVLTTEWPERKSGLKYGLQKHLLALHSQLEGYGVQFVSPEEWCQIKPPAKRDYTPKAYLTEKELKQLVQQPNFQLPTDRRLTPLALDFAKENQLI